MRISVFKAKIPSPTKIGEEDPDSVVLFVHGLGGSYWTWNKFSTHLKQNWNELETFDLEYDDYYESQGFFFSTPFIRILGKLWSVTFGPGIESLSRHLKTVIDQTCKEYKHVIIVAHSMGGIVARKYILDTLRETKTVGKTKALITYATPHHGSILANYYLIAVNILGLRIKRFRSKQIDNLSRKSSFLSELNKSWSELGVEGKIDFKRVVGQRDGVVDAESSAFRFDPNVSEVANKGHFSIIRPKKIGKDAAFYVTFNYLKDFGNKLEMEADKDKEYEDEADYYDTGYEEY